ncbi:14663_t:CDS:1, partial [Funneliformis geosporum]
YLELNKDVFSFHLLASGPDCAFSFIDAGGLCGRQILANAISALSTYVNSANGNWAKHAVGFRTSDESIT